MEELNWHCSYNIDYTPGWRLDSKTHYLLLRYTRFWYQCNPHKTETVGLPSSFTMINTTKPTDVYNVYRRTIYEAKCGCETLHKSQVCGCTDSTKKLCLKCAFCQVIFPSTVTSTRAIVKVVSHIWVWVWRCDRACWNCLQRHLSVIPGTLSIWYIS